MPVEIKELVIRAVVHQKAGQANGHDSAVSGGATGGPDAESEEREAIVAAAVKEVLRILRASQER